MYSYRVFTENDLKYDAPDNLKQLNRYDYINLTTIISLTSKQKMLSDLLGEYLKTQDMGFEYKDHILNRYYYQQFVIREKTDDGNQIRYYKYTLSDWDEKSKEEELDDRTLTIEVYTRDKDSDDLYRDICFKLKVGHKHELMNQIDDILPELEEQVEEYNTMIQDGRMPSDNKYRTEKNLYVIPLYFNLHPLVKITDDETNPIFKPDYVRISELKGNYSKNESLQILQMFPQAIYRFCIFNLYMINKVELNEEMIFVDTMTGHYETDNMIDYIRRHPTEDKHVLIRDFKNNLAIKIHPGRQNIYSRDNKSIRRLCDYMIQVHGHYQRYWYGSDKDGSKHVEWVWKESYPRNSHKPFRVIKEHEKEENV